MGTLYLWVEDKLLCPWEDKVMCLMIRGNPLKQRVPIFVVAIDVKAINAGFPELIVSDKL